MNDDAAKELLLEEYKAFSQSLENSEQAGETRVNWFIGIVTAGVGGLAKIFADGKTTGWSLRVIVIAGVAGLLAFGCVTLCRLIKRNQRTDELIHELRNIRRTFRGKPASGLLKNHYPFGEKPESDENLPRERTFGGLADLVLTINSLLIAALVAAFTMPVRAFSDHLEWVLAACLLTPAAFGLVFFLQRQLVKTS
jgi:hypothetical protein